jgi:hypothetical protein
MIEGGMPMSYSRLLPLAELQQRSVMYWLPPGGTDNGVWATTWTLIAELDAHDAQQILGKLAAADVGAYVAAPSGRYKPGSSTSMLYVDTIQFTLASDVLMQFLRAGRTPESGSRRSPLEPAAVVEPAMVRSSRSRKALRLASMVVKGALAAAALLVLIAAAYQAVVNHSAVFHEQVHEQEQPAHHLPGLTDHR